MKDKVFKWLLMRIKAPQPKFVEIDGEYVIPVRFSEDFAHGLLMGWTQMGPMGMAHLRPRDDGSFDMFVKTPERNEELNLVTLDSVENALMAALDLARSVLESDEEYDEDTVHAATEVSQLVRYAAE